jgi:hypothetical protein
VVAGPRLTLLVLWNPPAIDGRYGEGLAPKGSMGGQLAIAGGSAWRVGRGIPRNAVGAGLAGSRLAVPQPWRCIGVQL